MFNYMDWYVKINFSSEKFLRILSMFPLRVRLLCMVGNTFHFSTETNFNSLFITLIP